MDIKSLLLQLSVKEGEAKIAQKLFEEGPLSPTEISKTCRINRVSTYDYLKNLSQLGVITQAIKGKRKYYTLAHPRSLKKLIEQRKKEISNQENLLNECFENLVERYRNLAGRPGVAWFEGINGIQKMLMSYAEDNISGEVVGFSNTTLVEQAYNPKFLREFVKAKIANQIHSRYIIAEPNRLDIDNYLRKFYHGIPAKITPKIKKLPIGKKHFETEINIYDNKVSFIKIKPPVYFGVIINSAELANSLRIVFNFMWETLE